MVIAWLIFVADVPDKSHVGMAHALHFDILIMKILCFLYWNVKSLGASFFVT